MKFFDKDFCEIMQAGVVIFGKQVDNDVLYREIVNQPMLILPCIYSIFFLSILKIIKVFSKISVKRCKL